LLEEATGSSFVLVNSCFSSASSLERIRSPSAQIPCHKEALLMKLHQRPIAANKKRRRGGKTTKGEGKRQRIETPRQGTTTRAEEERRKEKQ
jgi:hypothetical protein